MKKELHIKKELPKGLVWRSTLAIVFVLGLLPFIAWLLEYKDTISAPLTITTTTTPVDVFARITGELELLVANNDLVQEGSPLAIIRNTATYADLEKLKEIVQESDASALEKAKQLATLKPLKVGEVQPNLVEVLKTLEDYQTFLATDRHLDLTKSRTAQIALYEQRKTLFLKKGKVIENDQSYATKIIERNRQLLDEGVIAEAEYDASDREKLVNELADIDNQTLVNELSIKIQQLQQEITEINSQFAENKMTYLNAIKDQLQLLENKIHAWDLTYSIKANITGHCIFKDYLNDYRFVKAGEKLFSLIPEAPEQYFALLQLPMQGAGKVQNGQEVYVKLNNYPFMDFGVLKGEITDISALPFEEQYNVQVHFPNGFTSTYDKTFDIAPLMYGVGEIIVERKSLWDRITNQLKSVRLNR